MNEQPATITLFGDADIPRYLRRYAAEVEAWARDAEDSPRVSPR